MVCTAAVTWTPWNSLKHWSNGNCVFFHHLWTSSLEIWELKKEKVNKTLSVFILCKLLYSYSLCLTVKAQQLSRKGTFYFVKLLSWTLQMKVRPTGLCEKKLKPIQLLELVRNFPESNFVSENTGGNFCKFYTKGDPRPTSKVWGSCLTHGKEHPSSEHYMP